MDKNPFGEGLESGGEVLTHPWAKKNLRWTHWVKEIVSLHLCHPSLKAAQLSAKKNLFSWQFLLQLRVRAWDFQATHAACCLRDPILFHPVQNTKVCCVTGGGEELIEQQPWLSKGIKWTRFLLIVWWTPLESTLGHLLVAPQL